MRNININHLTIWPLPQQWPISLPALKVTRRPTFSSKSVEIIQRGEPSRSSHQSVGLADHLDMDLGFSSVPTIVEPTTYELESRSSIAGWKEIRVKMRNAVTESSAMPLDQVCVVCGVLASIQCQQCGALGFYCLDCFVKSHCHVNFFHVAEKWEVIIIAIKMYFWFMRGPTYFINISENVLAIN